LDYCTLYIDGSGDYGWCVPDGNSDHKFHTLGGLILDPESDLKAKNKVGELLANYIPDSTRNIRPDNEYELHLVAIKGGAGIYRKIKKDVRQELINKTFELIKELNPILIASTVDKITEKSKWKEKAFDPQVFAMRSVVNKFSMHLNRLNKIGIVVYDADKYNFDLLLREEILRFRKYGINLKGPLYQPKTDYLPNILNNVNFCPSHLSAGLQLADFVASAIWRNYERNDNVWYNFIDPLWEYNASAGRYYKDGVIA